MEKISHAALLIKGMHHAICFEKMARQDKTIVQGFVTNEGRFVDRKKAYQIALLSGQIEPINGGPKILLSEDLWRDNYYLYDKKNGYYKIKLED